MNPRKISIDYLISDLLSETVYIETFQTLEDFQADINATLSYMYLVSIYDELHDAQDKSARLLSNNEKTLESIDDVDTFNFIQNFDMGDIPQIKLELDSTDFQPSFDQVNTFAQEMSDVYLNSYISAKEDYQAVTDQLLLDIQNTKELGKTQVNNVSSWQQVSGDWLKDAGKYQSDLENWRDGIENWRLASNTSIADYRTNFDANIIEIEDYRTKIINSADSVYDSAEKILAAYLLLYTDDYRNALDEYRGLLEDYDTDYVTVLEDRVIELEDLLDAEGVSVPARDTAIQTFIDAPAYDDDQPRVDAETNYNNTDFTADIDALQMILDDRDNGMLQTPQYDPLRPDTASFDALKDLRDAINTLAEYGVSSPDDTAVLNFPDATAITFGNFVTAIDAVETTAFSYDPLAYLTDADKARAEGIIGEYESEVSKTTSEFDKVQANHFELVTDAYTGYNEYVGELQQSVYEAYSDELDQVNSAKDLFVETGRATGAENHTLISDFASKMPNSRSGQSVNQTIAEFIAAPVELTHADIREALASGFTGDLQLPWRVLYICLGAIVVTMIVHLIQNARNRKKATMK
ncbi:MAG: hypothetical protein LBN12_05450 [Clostridiales Family XIII bacterium]|nr:hypothetical protein [Clostridiales Family XIII bacterium]